jgi:hypothetical protein
MTSLLFANFNEFSSSQVLALWLSGMGMATLGLISLVGIWAGAWTSVNKVRLEHALKQQMLDRGLSPDEMVSILASTRPHNRGVEFPCACEVVVDIDEEWHTALILKQEEDRYYVHVVGTDMSENQWVTGDRVRFPALNDGPSGQAGDCSFLSGIARMTYGCGNGDKAKPVGVDQEL